MPNVAQIISRHNNKTLNNNKQQQQQPMCNCRGSKVCPLDGNCLATGVVYQATVTRSDNNTSETYVGLCEDKFKFRYNNHTASFRHESKSSSTTLSQYVWKLKNNNINYNIKWRILTRSKSFSPTNKICRLCISEKYFIIFRPNLSTLNNRNELTSTCRHKRKLLLANT